MAVFYAAFTPNPTLRCGNKHNRTCVLPCCVGVTMPRHDWQPHRDTDCSDQKVVPGSSLQRKLSLDASTAIAAAPVRAPVKMNGKYCVSTEASDLALAQPYSCLPISSCIEQKSFTLLDLKCVL